MPFHDFSRNLCLFDTIKVTFGDIIVWVYFLFVKGNSDLCVCDTFASLMLNEKRISAIFILQCF